MALVQSPPPVAGPRIAGSLRLAARQFPRHRAAMVGLVCLALICLAAVLAPGLVQAPVLARMVRGSTLAVREDVYVTAARALGAGPARIVLSHLLRNVMSPIVVQLTIVFAAAVVAEASLSFLGFGAQPPQPSWGRDMSEARRFLGDAPWMFLAPTGTIMLCVLSINFLGDGLRDALDPRAWRTRRSLRDGDA